MLYTHKELLKQYKSNYQIQKAVREQVLFNVEKGIYSDKEHVHYLEVITKKYPHAIITGESAFYYHDLTDDIPDKIYLATKRNALKISDLRIKQIYISDNIFELGIETIVYEGTTINIYNKEKMLIELVRNRSKIAYDYYKEVILSYRKILDELHIWKIEQYLESYVLKERLLDIISKEVF